MAKIGTAHIEIKPVLNSEALDAIAQRIEDAVAEGVARGITRASKSEAFTAFTVTGQDRAFVAATVKAMRDWSLRGSL